MNKYTYKKSDGEDIWTVGHDDNGKWFPESDWASEYYASWRTDVLNKGLLEPIAVTHLRKRIEEMHEGYRLRMTSRDYSHRYNRGAADACGLILDLPELRLFLPAKDGGE